MPLATEGAPAHTPAWKRLGLKLKPATSNAPTNGSPAAAVGHPSSSTQSPKRKFDAPPSSYAAPGAKKPRWEGPQTASRNSQPPKKPSVRFAENPAQSTPSKGSSSKPTPPKKAKGPAPKKQAPPAVTDIGPSLEYLRQWKIARESWKFNKNHQSILIKHAFDNKLFPSKDFETFCEYIRDLKGFVRTRLREAAMEIRDHDISAGAAAFPDGTMDIDSKQVTYETIITKTMQTQQAGSKRKVFHELALVETSQEGDLIIRRVVKRIRAELVLDELSDSEQTDMTSSTSTSSRTMAANDGDEAQGAQPNTEQPVTGRRRRKLRVNDVEESSSSESESEDDSDTSSESSSSSEDSDDDDDEAADRMDVQVGQGDYITSDSSTSSESSEEDSDSEEDEPRPSTA